MGSLSRIEKAEKRDHDQLVIQFYIGCYSG